MIASPGDAGGDHVSVPGGAGGQAPSAPSPGGDFREASYRNEDWGQEPEAKVDSEYLVWYGTNRVPMDACDHGKGYSHERDSAVHLGTCRVYVPRSHRVGSVGSPWWQRLYRGDDRLSLEGVDALAEDAFWSAASAHLDRAGASDPARRVAVVFIHGYNVSFSEAARRAAQIGFDLSIRGMMAFFSWPSRGQARMYLADEATVEASEVDIARFIADVATRSGAREVHVIAHSMGNRATLRALEILAARKGQSKPIAQLILAAPDVDADVFRQRSACFGSVSRRATLYASARDKAVGAAKWLHGFPRAGFMPPVLVTPGVDTVSVTNVDVTALGHGYVGQARDVLRDMHQLIGHNAPPSDRLWLREVAEPKGRYWELRA